MNDEGWKRSSFCSNSACIQVRIEEDGGRWLRGSESRYMLYVTADEWAAFLAGAKAGEFDD